METKVKKTQVLAGTITAFLFLSLISGIYYQYQSKKEAINCLAQEKLKAESLLSEKLQLQKEIVDFRSQIDKLSGKNKDLDALLSKTKSDLDQKEKQVKSLIAENGTVKSLKKQLAELKQIKTNLEKQMDDLNLAMNKLRKENDELNKTLAALRSENEQMAENIKILQGIAADDFRVEGVKGKKAKLTVAAKKADKLIASFILPTDATSNVNFKVVLPSGEKIEKKEDGISYVFPDEDEELLASLDDFRGEMEVSKRIEMTYNPKCKLKSGVYKIEILNGDTYMGSCQIRLK
jgi:DNA repair exonuclease SbcCD ATPase subunit